MKNTFQIILSIMFLMMFSHLVQARDLPKIANLPVDKKIEPMRGFIEKHNAMESESLRISMGNDLNGFIEGKVCDFCETIKVTITPQTKAYNNNIEVPLITAKSRIGRFATVIYELDTKNVSAIRW